MRETVHFIGDPKYGVDRAEFGYGIKEQKYAKNTRIYEVRKRGRSINEGLFVSINHYQYKGLKVFVPNEIQFVLITNDNICLFVFFI